MSTIMPTMNQSFPRRIKPIEEPLGLYLRPGHNDHKLVCQVLSEGLSFTTGVVFDGSYVDEQEELRHEVNRRSLWSVIDPRSMELSTPGGLTERRKSLPWAADKPYTAAQLAGTNGDRHADLIVEFALEHEFSAILSPAHFLHKGYADDWFQVDLALAQRIKSQLALAGRTDIALFYPLAVPTKVFFDPAQRAALKQALISRAHVDELWLRVHPFGGHSGHVTLARYIQAARDLHDLPFAVIGEKVGTLGLALLAFGAVSGIEVGVSSGESFNVGRLAKRSAAKKGFAPHRGIYMSTLGLQLNRYEASKLFENRSLKASHTCQNPKCCREGSIDMLSNPRRHFVISRMSEVSGISSQPPTVRPTEFLEQHLRPATDRLVRAINADIPKTLKKKLERERGRLEGWRNTLGEMSRNQLLSRVARTPNRRTRAVAKSHSQARAS